MIWMIYLRKKPLHWTESRSAGVSTQYTEYGVISIQVRFFLIPTSLSLEKPVSNPTHDCYSRPEVSPHFLVCRGKSRPVPSVWMAERVAGGEGGYYIRWILESALFYDGTALLSHILCLPELCFDQLLSISYWMVQSPTSNTLQLRRCYTHI